MNSPLYTLHHQLIPAPTPLDAPTFCPTCRDKLPLFVTDELSGENVDRLYPDITFHLDVCPACLEEYESLSLLLNMAFRLSSSAFGEEFS